MFTCYDSSTPYIRNLCWSLNTIRQSSESTFYTGKYKKRVNDWFGLRARNVGIRTGRVAQRMWKKQTRNSNKWTSLWSEVFFVLRVTSKPIGKTLENRMFVVAKNRDCPQFLIWIFSGEGGGNNHVSMWTKFQSTFHNNCSVTSTWVSRGEWSLWRTIVYDSRGQTRSWGGQHHKWLGEIMNYWSVKNWVLIYRTKLALQWTQSEKLPFLSVRWMDEPTNCPEITDYYSIRE